MPIVLRDFRAATAINHQLYFTESCRQPQVDCGHNAAAA